MMSTSRPPRDLFFGGVRRCAHVLPRGFQRRQCFVLQDLREHLLLHLCWSFPIYPDGNDLLRIATELSRKRCWSHVLCAECVNPLLARAAAQLCYPLPLPGWYCTVTVQISASDFSRHDARTIPEASHSTSSLMGAIVT